MKLTVIDNLNLAPDDGVTYSVETSVGSIRIASGAANFTLSLSAYGWRKMGDAARTAYSCHYALYTRAGSTYTRRAYSSSKSTSWASGSQTIASTVDEVIVVISDSVMSAAAFASALPTSILAKTSVAVSKDGSAGNPGTNGKMCYIAGEYSKDIEYTSNSTQTVAVEVVNGNTTELWVLEASTNVTPGGTHIGPTDAYQEYWSKALNSYNLIRTKYLFADFAQLGSGIVSGDFIISRAGYIVVNGVKTYYAPNATYNNKPAYMWFDSAYPDTDNGNNNFMPVYAVNLANGTTYQQKSFISGTLHASLFEYKVYTQTGTMTSFSVPADADFYYFGSSNSGNLSVILPFAGDLAGKMITLIQPYLDDLDWTKIKLYGRDENGGTTGVFVILDVNHQPTAGTGYPIGKCSKVVVWADPADCANNGGTWHIMEQPMHIRAVLKQEGLIN